MYFHTRKPTNVIEEAKKMLSFCTTRPKPAYGRQGLDWIVRPGYSFGVFSTSRSEPLVLNWVDDPKTSRHRGSQLTSFDPKKRDVTDAGP